MLLLVAGTNPGAAFAEDAQEIAGCGDPIVSAEDQAALSTAELAPTSRELLEAKTGFEAETEEQDGDAAAPGAFEPSLRSAGSGSNANGPDHDDFPADGSGRLAARAPPTL